MLQCQSRDVDKLHRRIAMLNFLVMLTDPALGYSSIHVSVC
jgi:hypothetical protein